MSPSTCQKCDFHGHVVVNPDDKALQKTGHHHHCQQNHQHAEFRMHTTIRVRRHAAHWHFVRILGVAVSEPTEPYLCVQRFWGM